MRRCRVFARPSPRTITPHTEANLMNEIDDLDLKAEIDEISKKIDSIVRRIEQVDPNRQEPEPPQS